jgi:large subunit ribosomal protein L31e
MALERVYNIPLRKEWLKAPKYKRAKKAVAAVRQFLVRNMKAGLEDVRLGKYLNLRLWKHGIKNPPHHVRVKVVKDDAGKVTAELVDAPAGKKETVEQKIKKAAEEKKEEKEGKPEEKKKEAKEAGAAREEKKEKPEAREKKPARKEPAGKKK